MPTEQDRRYAQEILGTASANVARFRTGAASIRFETLDGRPLPGLEVSVTQKTSDFLFGNLAFDFVWEQNLYQPELLKKRFLELFNFAIFPFYWSTYERVPGRTTWEKCLPALEWCRANRIIPKGHPLVWPYDAGVPEWLYDLPEGSAEALIQARVLSLVKGFAGDIQTWDVTNEAVNHVSWAEASAPAFKNRYHETSAWRGIPVASAFKREIPIPEAADWVEKSLRWAYSANPRAALIVNDYNQEIDPTIRQRFFDLIQLLLDRGAPISGIGLQVHPVDHWIWPQELWDTLEMYAPLGLPIHITELHQPVSERAIEGGWKTGAWTAENQAGLIEQLYRLAFGHPSVVSINYWGLTDRHIWLPGAGLIDEEYRPKPVFTRLKELIKGEWSSPAFTAASDPRGEIHFSGFYGEYEAVARMPGQRHLAFPFHLSRQQPGEWVFRLPERRSAKRL